MKILSMYLPQFHRVKENDEWWGEGYTDWVSAKNAVSLYEGHYQPHIPKNQYYYDLMEKDTFEWQVSLMKKYGIDGQCIYHYWFKDGRQILEKPVERLLKWKDIDMPFCFCWANQSWANSWSAIKGANIWCDVRENKKQNDNDKGLLLEQQYGGEEEWRKHFDYLLPFFKDRRYIKIDNKPVFVLYQAICITSLEEMSECWNHWVQSEGFDGIYFIGANNKNETLVDAVLYPAPQTVMGDMLNAFTDAQLKVLDYKTVWGGMLNKAYIENRAMVGAFVGYDDTPRRGQRGCVIDNMRPEIFEENLTRLLAINVLHGQPFTFINAWNEWGEGMHLEPDEENGMVYLEAVCNAKKHYAEYLTEVRQIETSFYEKQAKELQNYKRELARFESYWRIMDKWLILKEEKKSIARILEEKNIHSVIIYGVGMLGRHLIRDLSGSSIKILCAIDRQDLKDNYEFPVIHLEDPIPKAEVIIVTPSYDFINIKKQLKKRGQSNIIAMESLFE